jgi:hypothetical protein
MALVLRVPQEQTYPLMLFVDTEGLVTVDHHHLAISQPSRVSTPP